MYVALALFQAVRINPSADIYFITDNEAAAKEVHFVPYERYKKSTDEFRSLYFHMSRQGFEVERLCIERWFAIRDLMHEKNLTRCFCLDTDVLLFNSVASIARRFADCDYTLLNGMSWGTVFINNVSVLDRFCEFILKTYHRDQEIWPLFADYTGFSRPYQPMNNLTDMGFVDMFHRLYGHEYRVREQGEIMEGQLIDPNFNIPNPGMVMDGRFKKVEWIEGFPFGQRADTGALVRYDLLHFQGVYAKGEMKKHFDAFTPTWEKVLAR